MKNVLRLFACLAFVGVAAGAFVLWAPVSGLESPRASLRAFLRLDDTALRGEGPEAGMVAPKRTQPAPVKPEAPAPAVKPRWLASPAEQETARAARARIEAWYRDGGVRNDRKLHVVYFLPTDRKPFPGYRERYTRILNYVTDYYAREMAANGLGPETFLLDHDADGLVKIHMAYGDKPTSGYDKYTNAGSETREAAYKVLREANIDPDKNHILIICQLPDGVSPYYGNLGSENGRCWVCDLCGLDSLNLASLADKAQTMKIADADTKVQADEIAKATGTPLTAEALAALMEENRKAYRGRALGPHTSVYVGGITHELGHCFNLPHTGESPLVTKTLGVSLMGQGTFTFGEEVRGKGPGTYLVPTDALTLISQPMFSHWDKEVTAKCTATFTNLRATPDGDGFRVTGRVVSPKIPVYAVILTFNLGTSGGDYHSNATGALVDPETGAFSVRVSRDFNGEADVMLTALHMNGKRSERHTTTLSRGTHVDTGRLNRVWAFDEAREAFAAHDKAGALAAVRAAVAANPGDAAIAALGAGWERALNPTKPGVTPAARPVSEKSVSLADCTAFEAVSGYGGMPAVTDRIPGSDRRDPVPDIGGAPVARALFTHANGRFVYDLGGAWKRLTGRFGVQSGSRGSVSLTIVGDGRKLYEGPVVGHMPRRAGKGRGEGDAEAKAFSVDVSGVKRLELLIGDGGDSVSSDHGVIADPTLSR